MREHRIHQIFEASILLKAMHAAIECFGGVALMLTSNQWMKHFVATATQTELAEDNKDFVANHLAAWAQGFSVESQHFYAWYLLSHGVVKLALIVGLLKRRLWAYPMMVAVLGLFIAYQIYRYSETQSVFLVLLSAFDAMVAILTWHEFTLMRRHLPVD